MNKNRNIINEHACNIVNVVRANLSLKDGRTFIRFIRLGLFRLATILLIFGMKLNCLKTNSIRSIEAIQIVYFFQTSVWISFKMNRYEKYSYRT